jgi:anti-anti-sigma factor
VCGLGIQVIHRAGHVSVAPVGELDIATNGVLEDRIAPLLQGDAIDLVVDLDRLSFIDVAGVRALARCAGTARQNGVRFSLLVTNERFRRLFDLCQLFGDLEIRCAPAAAEPR